MEKIKPKPMASNDSSDLPVEPNNTIYADRTKACWLLTHEFKQCLKKSDCMQVQNRSAGDCIKVMKCCCLVVYCEAHGIQSCCQHNARNRIL